MVSRAFWKNTHSWVFQKPQIALVLRTRAILIVFEKLVFVRVFSQIALEIMLLPICTNTFDNHACICALLPQPGSYVFTFICLFVCLSVCLSVCTVVHLEGVDAFCYNTRFPHWIFHVYPLLYRCCFYSSRVFVTFHCTEYLKKHTINVNEMQRITSLAVMLKQGMDVHCFVWIW